MKYTHSYLIHLQFLGFRFHGWQQQPQVKTLHQAVDKTLQFTLTNAFKTVGIGRTDAKVSASLYVVQLFVNATLDSEEFCSRFNANAPADLSVLSLTEVPTSFAIINATKRKEYHYYFCFGEKMHPFAAPLLGYFKGTLNIELMKKGARLFEGTHFFGAYCTQPTENTDLIRTLDSCCIEENTLLSASFFPKQTYVLKVTSSGFLRYQIRLMMGTLVALGRGDITLEDIAASLQKKKVQEPTPYIAPGSGLQLFDISIKL